MISACLEPTSRGTRRRPEPRSSTSRRTTSSSTSRPAPTTFACTTTIEFTAHHSPVPRRSPTWSMRPSTRSPSTVRSLDPATAYADSRIAARRPGRRRTTLVVRADCTYSHTGEGLHRFVDPVDDRVYLYTQFEVPDARRVFTTFEQPDLKGVVHLPRDRARRTGRSSPTRPPPSRSRLGDGRLRCGTSRRPSGCRRTSPRSSPASTTRCTTSTRASTATSRSATTAASRWWSTSTATSSSRSPSRASSSSRKPSTTPTRSASTTSSTCRSTTWARWRTPAA